MDALLRLQEAKGISAANLDLGRFDARLFTREDVEHVHGKAMPLRPARVHADQHFGPVL